MRLIDLPRCAALACDQLITNEHLLCHKHWLLAPKRTRRKYWRAVKQGQLDLDKSAYAANLIHWAAHNELVKLKKDCQRWYEMFMKQEGEI